MSKKRKFYSSPPSFFPFLVFLILWVFKSWFSFQPVTARDWVYFYPQNLKELPKTPRLWDNQSWGGMGRVNFYHWSLVCFWWPVKFLAFLGFPWPIIEKIIFFWPYLLLTVFSSAFLFKTLFPQNKLWLVSSFLYLFNTFSLIITSGGQMGFALAYAIAPLTLALFINFLTSLKINRLGNTILGGVVLGIQVMFDPRVAYITMMGVGTYLFINLLTSSKINGSLFYFLLSLFVALGLNLFWLLPVFLTRGPVLPETYGEAGWVKFLSFARFSDALSLLHPFWPENIFGKTYFFRPEYLLIPILAYSSLLFLRNPKQTRNNLTIQQLNHATILFFALLALLGAFLAKGSNPPFGEVYIWLFKNLPGFNMFRDPVKFYVLIALSYSVLIPYSVGRIAQWFSREITDEKRD